MTTIIGLICFAVLLAWGAKQLYEMIKDLFCD